MIKNDLFLKALRGETVERPPVWMMRQAGRYLPEFMALKKKYDFFTRCRTPELAAEITVQPIDIIGPDAAILFSDILVIPQAMNIEVEMKEGIGPWLPNPIRSAKDVEQVVIPEIHEELGYVMDAIKLTKEMLDNRVPLIGFAGSPWTILCYAVQGQGSKNFDKAKDTVQLTYLSSQGDTLANFSTKATDRKKMLKVEKGGNTHNWDTRGKGAERLKGMILWWANLNGAKAVPGNYKVSLNMNGTAQTENFKIVPDPRAEVSVADMQKQYDFISSVNETVDNAHQSIKKIRKINAKLDAFTKQYKDNEATKDLVEKAKRMKEGFSEVEKALYQTQNRSNQDPLNFPIRLTNKLAHLNSLVSIDDFPPTEQDIAVKNEMTTKINAQLAAFDKLVDEEMKAFNAEFNQLGLDYLSVED